jgi:hypothetical protein
LAAARQEAEMFRQELAQVRRVSEEAANNWSAEQGRHRTELTETLALVGRSKNHGCQKSNF